MKENAESTNVSGSSHTSASLSTDLSWSLTLEKASSILLSCLPVRVWMANGMRIFLPKPDDNTGGGGGGGGGGGEGREGGIMCIEVSLGPKFINPRLLTGTKVTSKSVAAFVL